MNQRDGLGRGRLFGNGPDAVDGKLAETAGEEADLQAAAEYAGWIHSEKKSGVGHRSRARWMPAAPERSHTKSRSIVSGGS